MNDNSVKYTELNRSNEINIINSNNVMSSDNISAKPQGKQLFADFANQQDTKKNEQSLRSKYGSNSQITIGNTNTGSEIKSYAPEENKSIPPVNSLNVNTSNKSGLNFVSENNSSNKAQALNITTHETSSVIPDSSGINKMLNTLNNNTQKSDKEDANIIPTRHILANTNDNPKEKPIKQEATVSAEQKNSNTNPEIENILNAIKTGVEKTNLGSEDKSENLMDMFDSVNNIDISDVFDSSDSVNSDNTSLNSDNHSAENAYKKNEAMLEDLFSFKSEPEDNSKNTSPVESEINFNSDTDYTETSHSFGEKEVNDSFQSDVKKIIQDSNNSNDTVSLQTDLQNQENIELEMNSVVKLDTTENQKTQENMQTSAENPQDQSGVMLDYGLFRAGFIIEEFSDDFLICAYYIKNILHQDCFSMKFINSKLFAATGKIADMTVADELIVKGYIKEYEVEFSKQYAITPDGERYFVAKFQS